MNYINKLIDDTVLHKFYNKYSKIFGGTKTLRDGYLLIDKIRIRNQERILALSIISNKRYYNQLDIETMIDVINDLNLCKYREEVYNKISQIMKLTSETAQIKTMTRIANSKPLKPIYISIKDVRDKQSDEITKKCPHCSLECTSDKNNNYIICGFEGNGY